ncbi:MAG: carbohydrate kinase family protein [Polyangiaceae bacterium]|nr:carbohydrate kinase family protein [Polyangiaceae bacterium]
MNIARKRHFDVICAGEVLWNLAAPSAGGGGKLRFIPGDGAVTVAMAIARAGIRVGLATVVEDDTPGRAMFDRIAASGVDVGGVAVAPARASLVFVDGTGAAREVGASADDGQPIAVPPSWSSRVLLLSGLSPVVSHEAALCKAARAGRRAGAIVVVDVRARWHLWAGRDTRAIRSVVREADVVSCRAEDFAILGLDASALRAQMRKDAVLVTSNGVCWASGPFGEIARKTPAALGLSATSVEDPLTVSICTELVRAGLPGDDRLDVWERAIDRIRALYDR